jgi:hypothetical protein
LRCTAERPDLFAIRIERRGAHLDIAVQKQTIFRQQYQLRALPTAAVDHFFRGAQIGAKVPAGMPLSHGDVQMIALGIGHSTSSASYPHRRI